MRLSTLLLALSCAVLAAWTPVDAATCATICSQKTVWGIGPASTGYAPCECTTAVNGRGSGTNECGCGVCYVQTGSKVTAFAVTGDGSCPFGATNCGDCDLPDAGSSGNSSSNKTTAPPSTATASNTPSPSLTSSAPSPSGTSSSVAGNTSLTPATPSPSPTRGSPSNTATDSSNGISANATTTASPSSSTTSSSNNGLAIWQISLIFCSGVLVMAVATMAFMSCYYKTRNRMDDNMEQEEEFVEYEDYWNPNASSGMATSGHEQLRQSAVNGIPMNGRGSSSSTHSRSSSTERMPYSEPTNAAEERIGAGMGRPLGSNGDLPGVFQVFSQRDVLPTREGGSYVNMEIEL